MSAEQDVIALFTLPPEEFVAARDALAKRLRAEGDREGATRARGLRRPTVPAWAVDQLAHRHADDVSLLLEAGGQLRHAQEQALSGQGGADLRAATAHRREVVEDLTDRAARILADAGRDPQPHRAAIATTLEAATVDADAAEALRSGTLSRELTPPSSFGDLLSATPPAPVPAPSTAPENEPAGRAEDRAARRREHEVGLERARDRERRAEQGVRDAERDAQDARSEAEAVAEEIERLEERLLEVRRRGEAALQRRERADAATAQARQTAQVRAAEAEQAQALLDEDPG